jgi:hypothetical protein
MGWRGTLVAGALLLIVALIFWLDEPPSGTPSRPGLPPAQQAGDSEPTPLAKLVDFQPAEVVGLKLVLDGQTRVTARQADGWMGSERSGLVDELLSDLTTLRALREIAAAPDELSHFGLQPPHSAIEVSLRGHSDPVVIVFGNRNPSTTSVYVRLGREGKVVLAGALLDWDLDKAFKSLAPPS